MNVILHHLFQIDLISSQKKISFLIRNLQVMEDITLIGKKREFAQSRSVPCGTEWRNDWKWVSYLLGCVPSLQMKEMCLVILGKGPKVVAQGDSNTDQPGF